MAAGRCVFEQRGYFETRVADIAAEAGVAHGTFYTYFESKEDLFAAIAEGVIAEVFELSRAPREGREFVERVRSGIGRYVDAYRRNARFMALIEQVATVDDRYRVTRASLRTLFVDRVSRLIEESIAAGVTPADLDVRVAATALVSMADEFTYTWVVLDEPFDDAVAVDTLTRLWAAALHLDRERAGAPAAAGAPRKRTAKSAR